jgi:hypothetical protein
MVENPAKERVLIDCDRSEVGGRGWEAEAADAITIMIR